MAGLNPEQRNYYYLLEAARTGIHKPVLAALYLAQRRPNLEDGEVGLGISPANRIPLEQVNSFPEQVQFAANSIRSITDRLTGQGWKSADIWSNEAGRYTDRFLQTVAAGYMPPVSDLTVARLEACSFETLAQAYVEDLTIDYKAGGLPQNLDYLDPALLQFAERLPRYYLGLGYQRDAILETLRIWRKLNNRVMAVASLMRLPETDPSLNTLDEIRLDQPLIQFVQQISPFYNGYPYQREALIRLTQLWRQLDSREEAIASLQNNPSAETNIQIIDPALVAFVQRIPQFYQSRGDQRNALTETYRVWNSLDSRTTVLIKLGIDPQILTASNPDRNALVNAATQLDRALIEFIKQIPFLYRENDQQREALIRLVQLWRNFDSREKAVQSLLDDVRRMERARRDSPDAPPKPEPATLPPRPPRWTPNNLQMHASIVPNGNFTWAEATHGGTRMPPNQATVDAMIRIATLAQQARDRIGRPFRITSWYRPSEINREVGGASQSQHMVGDAIDFYCDGLTGDQIYRALDPWWTGGLGRYSSYPDLCHIDARGYRARWIH